jgi:hypothetical protein
MSVTRTLGQVVPVLHTVTARLAAGCHTNPAISGAGRGLRSTESRRGEVGRRTESARGPGVAPGRPEQPRPYTSAAVPAQQIAQNLAYINWTVLVGLGFGSFVAVALARARTEAPRGYLAFTALCAAAFTALAWLSDGALATAGAAGTAGSTHATADPLIDQVRRFGLAVLAVDALIWAIAARRGASTRAIQGLSLAGIAAGSTALLAGAYGWGAGVITGLPLLVELVVLSAATGGVFAAMILGHWYLVTPKLGEAPLVLLARILLWIVALQVVLFVAWLATGAGVGTSPFGALAGPWALFVWLRLIVGLVFPLIVSWAALQTARTRSMESATGLLYINVGAIAAGTILASGLYFGAGLLT